jgi:serine protease AprX
MTRKKLALAGALACVAGVIVAGTGAGAASDSTDLRAVKVSPALLEQLQANPTGGVAATVTAWSRDELDAIQNVSGGAKLRALPMVLTRTLTLAQLERLQGMSGVRSVYPNRRYKLQMEDTTWITKARYVWATSSSGGPQGFGVTGKNVELAVIDTGFDGKHEDGDNLVEFCETQQAVTGDRTSVLCSPFNPATGNAGPAGPCGVPLNPCGPFLAGSARGDSTDDEGHGSHVGGTVAGTGHASGGTVANHSTIGMSPHAKLRVYSANIGPALLDHEILASYDDLTYKKDNGFNKVVAVNNSWGGGGGNYDASDPTSVAVKRAFDEGILSVFAAGNDGPEHETLSSQCVIPYVACVAATTKPDSVVMFSSRGRPTQPTDTNRDGEIDGDDVQPDNHDWRLGQALEKGRYRPTIAAPGTNINSISANSATCREDLLINTDVKSGCYEQLNGTSMATPHVTGAVGLIVQAYRQGHDGRTPTPNQIIDILERSANISKLPAWEPEEQGAGRLDVHEAVKIARGVTNPKRPNFGHPTPPYVEGDYPKGPEQPDFSAKGCTAAGSWTLKDLDTDPDTPLPDPPVGVGPFYGQHFIDVEPKTERLRITVRWREAANLYVRLWRPGIDPNADTNPAGQTRAFPDNESLGLLAPNGLPFFGPERLIEVRSPEAGTWTLRVYHRVGDASGCRATNETPTQPVRVAAVEYDVLAELPRVTHEPSVVIDSPAANAQTTGRFVEIKGRAGYPPPDNPSPGNVGHSWEGITQWEVPGTAGSVASEHDDPDPNNPRPVLYMHGNLEEGCTGQGEEDLIACGGPFLFEKAPDGVAAAVWRSGEDDIVFDGANDRTIHDPNWTWCLADPPPPGGSGCPATSQPGVPAGPKTIGGPMTVVWWATCEALCNLGADWIIRVWGDGQLKLEQRVSATPTTVPPIPDQLKVTLNVPTFTANQRVVVHIDPVFIDTQAITMIYYDSAASCPLGPAGSKCDSRVHMPVGTTGASPGGPAPDNVRVTDLPANAPYPAAPQTATLRIAWDPVAGASSYRVQRSTNPTGPWTTISGTSSECTSPEAPGNEPDSPPGHDRSGLCLTNSGLSFLTTYYHRVIAVRPDGQRSSPSEIAYNAPTKYDRQVKLKVDRLYGLQHWEYALEGASPTPPDTQNSGVQWRFLWDTLELVAGDHKVSARSFTQGIGSQNAERTLKDDGGNGGPGPRPGCPDDDDGDGDDDADDGDSDDNGDDGDDDCEDDNDDEEEDDD